jgi:hypothetical protein
MTAPLADRDLQLLDRYVDGALEGPALDALRAGGRKVAERAVTRAHAENGARCLRQAPPVPAGGDERARHQSTDAA